MIFDQAAAESMAREAANMSNKKQDIYQRRSGEYVICAEGMLQTLKEYVLQPNEQLRHITTIKPETA